MSSPQKKVEISPKTSRLKPYMVFLGLALLLYGNTLFNGYCLDDTIVIRENSFTRQGISGIPDIFKYESFTGFFGKDKQLVSGGRYRPFSIATFAVEYQFLGLNPFFSHLINLILYGLTAWMIFKVLKRLIPGKKGGRWYYHAAFWVAVLFLIHPVHTEVVANIKGRDELLAFLFSLLAFWQVLIFVDRKTAKHLWFAGLFFLPALFSKEHAVTFLLIIPLAVILFRKDSFKTSLQVFVTLLVPVFIFIVSRQAVLGQMLISSTGELLNNSFAEATPNQHLATVCYTLGRYMTLLVFPHPLTYDYYPYHISLTGWSWIPVVSLLVLIGIFLWAVISVRKNPVWFLSVLLFLLPLIPVSNLLFPIGTFMSERFIYIPSLGFCLGVVYGIINYLKLSRPVWISLGIIVGLFFCGKTISRNSVWKDDLTLFTTDVKVSSESAKGNCAAGGILYDTYKMLPETPERREKLTSALNFLRKSVIIYPSYRDAWLLLGNTYTCFPDSVMKSMNCYEEVVRLNPGDEKALNNMEYLPGLIKDPQLKVRILEKALQYHPDSYNLLNQLGNTWGKMLQDIPKAIYYLEKAHKINPGGIDAMKDLGVAYAMQSKFQEAQAMFRQAVQADSTDAAIWSNLGLTYQALKNMEMANVCFHRAAALQGKKN